MSQNDDHTAGGVRQPTSHAGEQDAAPSLAEPRVMEPDVAALAPDAPEAPTPTEPASMFVGASDLEARARQATFHAPERRILLGGSLWTFGALLWAYLVMGELVVNFELNEVLAMLTVSAALIVAWFGAAQQIAPGKLSRKIAPGVIGILLWWFALLVASALLGTTKSSTIEALTVLLCFPAVFAYFWGRRLMAKTTLDRSPRRRAGSVVLWIATSAVTALALISAISRA